jgi:hypothetical protein
LAVVAPGWRETHPITWAISRVKLAVLLLTARGGSVF